MKIKTVVMAAIVAAGVSFTSCEQGDQTPQLELKFNTVTTPLSLVDAKKAVQEPKELAFTSGYITLREVEFEVETDNDSIEINFEIEINTRIDFATGETNPDISFVEIPAGTYNELEVEIELESEGDGPAMVLEGTYTDAQGVDHPVRFEFNSRETFEIEKEGTITFAVSESALAQITFDPTVWFADVSNEDFSQASKNMDGVIVISSTENKDIYDVATDGLDLADEVEIEFN